MTQQRDGPCVFTLGSAVVLHFYWYNINQCFKFVTAGRGKHEDLEQTFSCMFSFLLRNSHVNSRPKQIQHFWESEELNWPKLILNTNSWFRSNVLTWFQPFQSVSVIRSDHILFHTLENQFLWICIENKQKLTLILTCMRVTKLKRKPSGAHFRHKLDLTQPVKIYKYNLRTRVKLLSALDNIQHIQPVLRNIQIC